MVAARQGGGIAGHAIGEEATAALSKNANSMMKAAKEQKAADN